VRSITPCLTSFDYPYVDSAALFSKVADQHWAVFLDSGVIEAHRPVTKHADYDVLAINPEVTLITQGDYTTIDNGGAAYRSDVDPLKLLKLELRGWHNHAVDQGQTEFAYGPGALGYFSYDLSRRFEEMPTLAQDNAQLPEMAMGLYGVVVVVDHLLKTTTVVARLDSEQAQSTLRQWQLLLDQHCLTGALATKSAVKVKLMSDQIEENMDRQQYQQRFAAVRDYTVAGDCYQVNLTKQFSANVQGNAWQTYFELRDQSPAPYGAFINLPFAQILSNSPESFIQCRQRQVITSPIKGTSPRDHANPENDQKIAKQLENSPKDRAENLMIVDLMRNDLSRCCELASIRVPKLFALHSFANVHHLISTVTGTLKSSLHVLDLLRACFPGGSITGAPKIRAMQIIEELEPHRRGLYCGAIGYVGADGNLETNIAIRTIVVKDGVARYSAGGGLVIDSQQDQEYQEIIDKARMMTQALTG
jgi:para-aminobenzoate synthetase component 1